MQGNWDCALGLSPVTSYSGVNTLHVQGNCLQAPSDDILAAVGANAAPLRPLQPGQCLIMSDGDFLQVLGDRVLWVDNLYVRQSTAAGV